VFDNDGVNGSKSARTSVMQWRMPTLDEFRKEQAQTSEEIQRDLEKALKESAKIQEEMKKLRSKVLQQKELDWQSRKEMEKLMTAKKLQDQIGAGQREF
jgi:seryl-tRNA synthetase